MATQTETESISAQLAKLREEEEKPLGARASLFNLVFYCEDLRRMEFLQTIVQAASARFPCRIIFIQGDNNWSNPSPNVKLFNKTFKDISCDHIQITVSPQQLNRIPFLVLPYLLPDIPLFLIWGQDPTSDTQILPHLLPYASRFIFDADNIFDFTAFSKSILEMMSTYPQTTFVDVTWTLTLGWRQILYQLFNNPETSEQLRNSNEILINYNSRQEPWMLHTDVQAFYFSQWLATRMEWLSSCSEMPGQRSSYSCQTESGKCQIVLKPEVKEQLFPGTIFSIEINSPAHQCIIAPFNQTAKVVVHITHENTCELPFALPLQNFKNSFPFIKELLFEPQSAHYKNVLQL